MSHVVARNATANASQIVKEEKPAQKRKRNTFEAATLNPPRCRSCVRCVVIGGHSMPACWKTTTTGKYLAASQSCANRNQECRRVTRFATGPSRSPRTSLWGVRVLPRAAPTAGVASLYTVKPRIFAAPLQVMGTFTPTTHPEYRALVKGTPYPDRGISLTKGFPGGAQVEPLHFLLPALANVGRVGRRRAPISESTGKRARRL